MGLRNLSVIVALLAACGWTGALAQTNTPAPQPADEKKADQTEEAAQKTAIVVPLFRHVEANPPSFEVQAVRRVRFLTDISFPPFSYSNANGSLTGLNVAIADAICNDLRIRCEFIVKPYAELRPALANGEGDAILSGVRMTEASFETLDFTRPYFRSLGRFAVQRENTIKRPDRKALAGKRIGVRKGSAHEAFLKAHFTRSKILQYDQDAKMREALRTGAVDALFGDAVQLMFWIHSETSKGCCRITEGAFHDRTYLNAPLAIAVKRGNRKLRDVLDHGLDRLQTSGQFTRIYRTFFPESVW